MYTNQACISFMDIEVFSYWREPQVSDFTPYRRLLPPSPYHEEDKERDT